MRFPRQFFAHFWPLLRPFSHRWAQLSCSSQQPSSCHPQVRQRKQHEHLRRVLGQTAIAHFHVAKLPLDHPERVLPPRPPLGLEMLQMLSCFLLLAFGQPLYLTAPFGNPPIHLHPSHLGPVLRAGATRCSIHHLSLHTPP